MYVRFDKPIIHNRICNVNTKLNEILTINNAITNEVNTRSIIIATVVPLPLKLMKSGDKYWEPLEIILVVFRAISKDGEIIARQFFRLTEAMAKHTALNNALNWPVICLDKIGDELADILAQ